MAVSSSIAGSLFALSQLQSMKKKIEADKKLEEVTIENIERESEKEKELSSKQKVEGLSPSEECGTEGNRPDNKKEVVQGGESASQKPKRRGVRKHREQ